MGLIGSRPKNAEDAWLAPATAQCRCFRDHHGLLALGYRPTCICFAGVVGLHMYLNSLNDRARIDRLINRLRRGVYLLRDHPCFEELANKAEHWLFKAISTNKNHFLAKYLPEIKATGHNLQQTDRFNTIGTVE